MCLVAPDDESAKRRPTSLPPTLMAAFLRRDVYIALDDGRRAIRGVLVCVDREGNAILQEATEHLLGQTEPGPRAERVMPLVMIPGRHIVRVATKDLSCLYT